MKFPLTNFALQSLLLFSLLGYAATSAADAAPAIVIDGDIADWKDIAPLATDAAEGAAPCDWRKAFFANDKSTLFLRYTTEGTIDFSKGAAYMVLLDTDRSKQTGFQGSSGEFAIGADYLLQGLTLYVYTGTGQDWAWQSVGTVTGQPNNNEVEFAIERDQIGNPQGVDVLFYGDNEADGVGGSVLDLMPDADAADGKVTYLLK